MNKSQLSQALSTQAILAGIRGDKRSQKQLEDQLRRNNRERSNDRK